MSELPTTSRMGMQVRLHPGSAPDTWVTRVVDDETSQVVRMSYRGEWLEAFESSLEKTSVTFSAARNARTTPMSEREITQEMESAILVAAEHADNLMFLSEQDFLGGIPDDGEGEEQDRGERGPGSADDVETNTQTWSERALEPRGTKHTRQVEEDPRDGGQAAKRSRGVAERCLED